MSLYSSDRKKWYEYGWVGKWTGPGRNWRWQNHNQNILYRKNIYFQFYKKIYTAMTTKTKYKRVLFILFSSKAADVICISESLLGKDPSLSPHIQAYA